jgi:hypothetical protein
MVSYSKIKIIVYETYKESGGSWWPKIFNLLCFSVAVFQLMTGGCIWILSASKSSTGNGKAQATIVFVQILITGCYWFIVTSKFRNELSSMKIEFPPGASPKLDYLVSDPAMGDPLPKVWVKEEFKDKLTFEHQPKYSSAIDYMKAKNIKNPRHMESLIRRAGAFGYRNQKVLSTPSSGQLVPPEVIMSLQQ